MILQLDRAGLRRSQSRHLPGVLGVRTAGASLPALTCGCASCGGALAEETPAPATHELAPNRWGDLLVLASLAVRAFLLHTVLWREF